MKTDKLPITKKPVSILEMGTWSTAEIKARSLLKRGYKPQILLDKKNKTWKIEVYD